MSVRQAYVVFCLVCLLLCAASVALFVMLKLTGIWLGVAFAVSFVLFCLAWVTGVAACKRRPRESVRGSFWQIVIELIANLA